MNVVQKASQEKEHYLDTFKALERNGYSSDPSWLQEIRRDAISHFNELGFPTARRGNEEWKYTDVKPLARTPFHHVDRPGPGPSQEELRRFLLKESEWARLVFVDGRLDESLSHAAREDGLTFTSLRRALSDSPGLLETHLARYKRYEDNAFVALNTAFIRDGALVHLAEGAAVKDPVHIVHVTTASQPDAVSHPRTLIVAERDSEAQIVESYWTLSDERYFTNAVTEVLVGEGATLRYHKMESQSEKAYHVTNTQVVQKRHSYFSSINIDIGGRLVRNNIDLLTYDENTDSLLNGLYLITGLQHVDNQLILDHAKPYTTSSELYKGVLGGKSRSVFHGSIIVRPGAIKVNANQVDKNLLLSDKAEADTKPAFWIYCDDVKCGHGAACGQMDEQSLFYLRSRGLDEETARTFLTRGFVNEIIESIENETLRRRIDELVQEKLRKIKWTIGKA